MQTEINISDIIPPNQLYKVDPLEFSRIKESIKNHGLFHALILQGDNPPYKIIAGRARFLAIKELNEERFKFAQASDTIPEYKIPATILPTSCQNPQELSLHENLRRKNLQWYDQVELEKELHDLRVSQNGEASSKGGRPSSSGKVGWSQNDTARELGLALGTFSQDMSLATELARNPNLRSVKDKTTALKLIRNINKRQIAELEQAMPNSEMEFDDVYLGDSAIILKTFPKEIFDVCITDPPWSEYKDENLRSDQESLLPIFFELYRVLKRDSFLLIVTSTTDFYFYKKELPKFGFKVQSYPIIWWKTKTITHGRAPWQFARDYEPIIIAVKGDPSLTTGIEISSIFKYDNLHYSQMIHPNEKPIDLIKNLLQITSNNGAKVVDPFSGSGVVLEACKKSDRRYIGIEKEKNFYDKIVERLKK